MFAAIPEADLLSFGVPVEWLAEVRKATEDTILALADHLPSEAGEALLELATGGKPQAQRSAPAGASPFDHPDAQRRFRVVSNVEELARALDYPWEKWTVFLHPAQRELVEREFNGPARISGSAGTGKTIVALHRAVFLARSNPHARVLLTTFSESLASALRLRLQQLVGSQPRIGERIEVSSVAAVARRLCESNLGPPEVAAPNVIRDLIRDAAANGLDQKFSLHFLLSEWDEVVDAWQLRSWEAYRDALRLGRKARLPEKARRSLWAIFERVRNALDERGLITDADLYSRIAAHLAARQHGPFDFVIVDEAQDVGVAQLRFIASLGGARPSGLFFTGDLGQRIFQLPFSWKSLGVDIRGRSATLRINYRTSHQIRALADQLLGSEVSDVDGNIEDRHGTISVFNGPRPVVTVETSREAEIADVAHWLADRITEGVKPAEIGVFVRSLAELPRAQVAIEAAGLTYEVLDEAIKPSTHSVALGTMHLSKGLEFKVVVVMACDDEVLPLQTRISAVTDDGDLEEVYNTERHLLYVACTRARDHLLVTGVRPASEFLNDLGEALSAAPLISHA